MLPDTYHYVFLLTGSMDGLKRSFSVVIFEMSKPFTHVKLSLSDKASSMSIHIPVHSPSTL